MENGTILEGLDGIEVFYPIHDFEMENYLLGKCREKGLLASGGSDDHKAPVDGPEYKIGSVNIPDIPETRWIKEVAISGKEYLGNEFGLKNLISDLKDYEER